MSIPGLYSHFRAQRKDPHGVTSRLYGHPISLAKAREEMKDYDRIDVDINGKWVEIDKVQEK